MNNEGFGDLPHQISLTAKPLSECSLPRVQLSRTSEADFRTSGRVASGLGKFPPHEGAFKLGNSSEATEETPPESLSVLSVPLLPNTYFKSSFAALKAAAERNRFCATFASFSAASRSRSRA
jgi:hypothetical protein